MAYFTNVLYLIYSENSKDPIVLYFQYGCFSELFWIVYKAMRIKDHYSNHPFIDLVF